MNKNIIVHVNNKFALDNLVFNDLNCANVEQLLNLTS